MRIAILTIDTAGNWHTGDLCRAAQQRGHKTQVHVWSELSGDSPQFDDVDAVLLRNIGMGTLEQIVFRMDVIGQLERQGKCVINPPRAMEIAVDKYLATARMRDAGLPTPQTMTYQDVDSAMNGFDRLGGDVVVKPLFGSEGKGIERLSCRDDARELFTGLVVEGKIIYQQRFIDHGGSDVRLFVIGGKIIAGMRRVSDDWRTNIACGGRGESIEPDAMDCDLAIRAANTCGTQVAGIDILHDRDGKPYVLEVNAVPGWRAIQSVAGIDIADQIIQHVETIHERPTGNASVHCGSALAQSG
jgi:ribosomal protein S6--L-glutamate ligase